MTDAIPIRNPFRNRIRSAIFEAAVRCYRTRHPDLFRPDGRRASDASAQAMNFWRGYDGVTPERWRGDGRETNSYAFYRAGQAIAAAVATGAIPEQPCVPSRNTRASAVAAPAATESPVQTTSAILKPASTCRHKAR